jgi:hypothetical protein
LVGKPEGKSQFWRYRSWWEDNIKIGLEESGMVVCQLGFLRYVTKIFYIVHRVRLKKIIRSLRVALFNGSNRTDSPIFLSPSEYEGRSCLWSIRAFYPETVDSIQNSSHNSCWLPCSRFSEWCWWGFRSVVLSRGPDFS